MSAFSIPSKTENKCWLTAYSVLENSEDIDRAESGKWLVFLTLPEIDQVWQKVALLTEVGKLGFKSLAATAKPYPNAHALDSNKKVIVIYTKNYNDLDDVARVAWTLYTENIFKEGKLKYKTDEATSDGLYSIDGVITSIYSIEMNSFKQIESEEKLALFLKRKYRDLSENKVGEFYNKIEIPPSKDLIKSIHTVTNNKDVTLAPDAGKWTMFVPLSELDETWKKIAQLTIEGRLGPQSSTVTAKPNPKAKDANIKTIFIYTKSYRDFQDMANVALTLFKENVLKGKVIHYKSNLMLTDNSNSSNKSQPALSMSISVQSIALNNTPKELAKFLIDKS